METAFSLYFKVYGGWNDMSPSWITTSDPVASMINFSRFNQDYNTLRQDLWMGNAGNYSALEINFPCELDGVVCRKVNNSFVEIDSFIINSVDRYNVDKTNCNAGPINIPASFSNLRALNITGVNCMHSFSFPVPFTKLKVLDLSRDNMNSSFLSLNFTTFTPSLQSMMLNYNNFASFQGFPLQTIPNSLTYVSLIQTNIPTMSFPPQAKIQYLFGAKFWKERVWADRSFGEKP
jgi:hypothetical protein